MHVSKKLFDIKKKTLDIKVWKFGMILLENWGMVSVCEKSRHGATFYHASRSYSTIAIVIINKYLITIVNKFPTSFLIYHFPKFSLHFLHQKKREIKIIKWWNQTYQKPKKNTKKGNLKPNITKKRKLNEESKLILKDGTWSFYLNTTREFFLLLNFFFVVP